jgi:uncharacterized protein YkwD
VFSRKLTALAQLCLLGLLILCGCGSGPGGITLPPGNNPGGGNNNAFNPPVSTPARESYQSLAPAGSSAGNRWLRNSYQTLPAGTYQNASLKLWADQIAASINNARMDAGLPSLRFSTSMAKVAQAHARDMALRDYFAHDTPEGLSPFQRLDLANASGQGRAAAENIARGQESVSAIMQSWLSSSGHRANILNPRYDTLGIGVYFDASNSRDQIYCVALFADN